MKQGMICNVYRNNHDCTNNGITSKVDKVVLTGYGIPELFSPNEKMPELKLIRRIISGNEYLHVEPINPATSNGWFAGGNFIFSHDSRFPNKYPLSVHDRQEY